MIDTLFNIARLLTDFTNDAAGVRMKHAIAVHITNIANGFADALDVIKLCVARDLTGKHNQITFCERLARDAAQRVLLEAGVKNVIADRVANFVGVTFRD